MSEPSRPLLSPIGLIHSCYPEKFGIPRQPGLVKSSRGRLQLLPPCNRPEMVKGLETFSHIWVHFCFHGAMAEGWRPTVRPPWLDGQKRVGVFASRSPHRPNFLGLSVVRLLGISAGKRVYSWKYPSLTYLIRHQFLTLNPTFPIVMQCARPRLAVSLPLSRYSGRCCSPRQRRHRVCSMNSRPDDNSSC